MRRIQILALCALAACGTSGVAPERQRERPNFVVVFIDDMGYADLSCFGGEEAETRHIDRLAREGITFRQFYVNSPICSPSRVAISTGQYPQRWRISSYLAHREKNESRGMASWLDPAAPMLARTLSEAGYATGHFGKWHMGGQRDVGDAPLIGEYGFEESLTNFEGLGPRVLPMLEAYDGSEARPHALGSDRLGSGPVVWEERALVTRSFTRAAIDFIRRAQEEGRPFYVNLWPDDVHSPFFPPAELRGDGSKRARYHGVLTRMDEDLGELFDLLRGDEGLRDNTLVLLCSDNGPEKGAGSAGRLRGFKTHLFEGGIRSPLVVWGPGRVKPGDNTESVLSAMDLVPSLLALAGLRPSVALDGEDLSDVLTGASKRSRQSPLYFRRPPDRDSYYGVKDLPDLAVREGSWKLTTEFDATATALYDLDQDPGETRDVADLHPELVRRLLEGLLAWDREMPPDAGDPSR